MLNWDLIATKLSESRPGHTGKFRVLIYSRMSMVSGQESVAATHVKWMQMAVNRDSRFAVQKVYQDFGVTARDSSKMLGYQKVLAECQAGNADLVMVFDLSRLGKTYDDFMANVEPISQCDPEIGVLILHDQVFCLGSQAHEWAKKMARGDYSSCQLPYYVGRLDSKK